MIEIVCPTMWRAGRLADFVANIHYATDLPHRVTFVAESHDADTIDAVQSLDDPAVHLLINERSPTVLGALNTGAAAVVEPWWFLAGDDLLFGDGWDVIALAVLVDHPEAKVIGTNDLHHPRVLSGDTATHMLIETDYTRTRGVTIDGPGLACSELYEHDYPDTEAVVVAKARGVWQPCLASIVEHRHPAWGLADRDATYDHHFNGRAMRDARTFRHRRRRLERAA